MEQVNNIYNRLADLEHKENKVKLRGNNSTFPDILKDELESLRDQYSKLEVKGKITSQYKTCWNRKLRRIVKLVPDLVCPEELTDGLDGKFFIKSIDPKSKKNNVKK